MCREQQIVQFQISTPPSYYLKLEKRIQEQYNLKDVKIIPSVTSRDLTLANVGKVAADYLENIIHDNIKIGISWGTTIKKFVNEFSTSKKLLNVTVMQLTGGLHAQDIAINGNELTQQLAAKLNAKPMLLHVPAIVQNQVLKKMLLDEPGIANHFRAFDDIDIAIIGFGSSNPRDNISYLAGYISLAEAEELVKMGLGGELCGQRITFEGYPADSTLNDRVLSINCDTLRIIPTVIGIGIGKEKACSILAALKGKFVNVLIIDELAALSIIGN
jgi:DNA-binding transcriptional regulator LsrR (DeoR family)